eukprot:6493225-Karenia_brevis.AAC.1
MAVSDSDCVRNFKELLAAPPIVPYYVEPSTHVHIVHKWVESAACQAFPVRKKQCKKPYFTKKTFDLICDKVWYSKKYLQYARYNRLAPMRAAFYIWCDKPWWAKWSRVRGFCLKADCMRQVFHGAAAAALAPQVKSLMQMETLAHIQDKAEKVESMFGVGDPHIIAKHIKSFMPRFKGRA